MQDRPGAWVRASARGGKDVFGRQNSTPRVHPIQDAVDERRLDELSPLKVLVFATEVEARSLHVLYPCRGARQEYPTGAMDW